MSVSEPGPEDERWEALAAELTPAKSLARIDTVTARVVSTVSVVGTLLTGLGLVAADRLDGALVRPAAVATVCLSVAAVVCALAAQVMTVTRGLNPNNHVALERWYRRWFERRAPLTRLASILLVLAALAGGVVGVAAAATAGPDDVPMLTVTRTADTVVVKARFSGLDPGTVATLSVTGLAQAAVVAGDDGVAEREVTVPKVPASTTVTVASTAADQACTARSAPGESWAVSCRRAPG